ncbi:uncharacterized protein EV154DRAFT_484241 [Mucor mucedo]|uniref:uncharacterized protein n=1 Tax=Mucor mucedo TaxID=29922 RepID=UPI00221F7201|nr:uncharacterized protein EV154DRAFT_484241 [Mucor mucedo]KAI7888275.1 hypothetical protein EV154DRAFT_484241 [Mucor mucedo]
MKALVLLLCFLVDLKANIARDDAHYVFIVVRFCCFGVRSGSRYLQVTTMHLQGAFHLPVWGPLGAGTSLSVICVHMKALVLLLCFASTEHCAKPKPIVVHLQGAFHLPVWSPLGAGTSLSVICVHMKALVLLLCFLVDLKANIARDDAHYVFIVVRFCCFGVRSGSRYLQLVDLKANIARDDAHYVFIVNILQLLIGPSICCVLANVCFTALKKEYCFSYVLFSLSLSLPLSLTYLASDCKKNVQKPLAVAIDNIFRHVYDQYIIKLILLFTHRHPIALLR